ncbi:nitrate reductase cytochrome c-type subunit [Ferrimonas pelagia]|uniref:Periplasmic nitrate reductase, electron transfer subunit n=1 Tax=Ferrimonas pelagia TaxID=1177826 RepID=A0ABP9F7U4_9GAMM
MNKLNVSAAALVLLLAGCQLGSEPAGEAPLSTRGDVAVAATSPVPQAVEFPSRGVSVAVELEGMTPIIPHKADYPITLKRNGCVMCHSRGKQKMSERHYGDDAKLDGHYYQCLTCHVPQSQPIQF